MLQVLMLPCSVCMLSRAHLTSDNLSPLLALITELLISRMCYWKHCFHSVLGNSFEFVSQQLTQINVSVVDDACALIEFDGLSAHTKMLYCLLLVCLFFFTSKRAFLLFVCVRKYIRCLSYN